jgi:hypothetical protein
VRDSSKKLIEWRGGAFLVIGAFLYSLALILGMMYYEGVLG